MTFVPEFYNTKGNNRGNKIWLFPVNENLYHYIHERMMGEDAHIFWRGSVQGLLCGAESFWIHLENHTEDMVAKGLITTDEEDIFRIVMRMSDYGWYLVFVDKEE